MTVKVEATQKQYIVVLQETLDALRTHKSVKKAAASLNVSISTFKRRLKEVQRRTANRPNAKKVPPLSEDEKKFKKNWGSEDCIAHIRAIAKANPRRAMSRNWFRNNSDISESTWTRYFGTFLEFKRQANIIPTRYQHAMEKAVAKHASVDLMRKITEEKQYWGQEYLKPSGKRFQTIVVGSDVHDIECDPFWRKCFIDTIARVKPEKIVLNGDIFDLPEFGKYTQDPREWDVVKRIAWVHKFLEDIREASADSEIIFLEGNHEYRLLRHLAEESPAMRAILSDLHGMTVPDLLGLKKFEVNYIAPADLSAFTKADMSAEVARNWVLLYNFIVGHHYPTGFKFGLPGWNGHHHLHIVRPGFNPKQGAYEWHQLGSGHKRQASYCDGERWSNGFLLAHVDTQREKVQFEYIDIQDHVVIGGKWMVR